MMTRMMWQNRHVPKPGQVSPEAGKNQLANPKVNHQVITSSKQATAP
jgi:hypothetical protein